MNKLIAVNDDMYKMSPQMAINMLTLDEIDLRIESLYKYFTFLNCKVPSGLNFIEYNHMVLLYDTLKTLHIIRHDFVTSINV